jgi:hypothetical protein
MLPTFIRNAQEFGATVTLKVTPESVVLDFKAALHGMLAKGVAKREAHKELARDIAQFANTYGGTLLIGVSEDSKTAPSVADAVVSVPAPEAAQQWIAQAAQAYLVPSTLSIDVKAFAVSGGTVLAINVPASADLVAVWDRESHAIEYVWRDGNAKAYMNPDEAERHRMDTGRAARLRLLDAMDSQQEAAAHLAGRIYRRIVHPSAIQTDVERVDAVNIRLVGSEDVFELIATIRGNRPTIRIPYNAIEAVWRDDNRRVGLILRYPVVYENEVLVLDVHPPRR